MRFFSSALCLVNSVLLALSASSNFFSSCVCASRLFFNDSSSSSHGVGSTDSALTSFAAFASTSDDLARYSAMFFAFWAAASSVIFRSASICPRSDPLPWINCLSWSLALLRFAMLPSRLKMVSLFSEMILAFSSSIFSFSCWAAVISEILAASSFSLAAIAAVRSAISLALLTTSWSYSLVLAASSLLLLLMLASSIAFLFLSSAMSASRYPILVLRMARCSSQSRSLTRRPSSWEKSVVISASPGRRMEGCSKKRAATNAVFASSFAAAMSVALMPAVLTLTLPAHSTSLLALSSRLSVESTSSMPSVCLGRICLRTLT
eukprot:comp24921_c0_seq1/m.46914 comp24921_c0_seq1/g.46914  ORF comp24921_c0_seq1/g.46914 comp24921_c0_seq1/m.46914 type:complete len:321 (+) comp24921_c0_seq1:586-1548(+)